MSEQRDQQLFSIAEAQQALRVSLPTVRRMLDKQLRTVRIGRRVLITAASLNALVRGESEAVSR
jgi:excisionase family DNA binding protein